MFTFFDAFHSASNVCDVLLLMITQTISFHKDMPNPYRIWLLCNVFLFTLQHGKLSLYVMFFREWWNFSFCSGILIKTLADASSDQHSLSASEIIFNVIGFCITVATTVVITLYGKRRLNELQRDEDLLQWS